MIIVSSREFRENQKMYFDLVDNNEQVIVQRGKNKAYIFVPVSDKDKLSLNQELIEKVKKAENDLKEGKAVRISDPNKIWESIL